tara:strand:- start:2987 stop:3598 length:612 start_codon:yes stop_codon:yes gene_type:complete
MIRLVSQVIFVVIIFSDLVLAGEGSGPARFEKGHYEFGAEVGYGVGHNIPFAKNRTHIQFAHIAANFQLDLTGNIGRSYSQGNLNWYPEFNASLLHNPDSGTLIGFSPLMFQYKFIKPRRKWAPTVLGGAGIALTDWDEDNLAATEISGDFQFLLHAGFGLEYFRPKSGSFSVNYRLLHVSNAGMERPNVGLNASLITLAFTF